MLFVLSLALLQRIASDSLRIHTLIGYAKQHKQLCEEVERQRQERLDERSALWFLLTRACVWCVRVGVGVGLPRASRVFAMPLYGSHAAYNRNSVMRQRHAPCHLPSQTVLNSARLPFS